MSAQVDNPTDIEWKAQKLYFMNTKLDELIQLAHQLNVQSKAMSIGSDKDMMFFAEQPLRRHAMLTSTPAAKVRKTEKFSSMSPAQQLEILHEVANEHTKVALDFEGLRQAVIAHQRVIALKNIFDIEQGEIRPDPEEEAYVNDLFNESKASSLKLIELVADYLESTKKLFSLKVEASVKFGEWMKLFAEAYGDDNADNVINDPSNDSIEKKKKALKKEENKLEQLKVLTQKLMLSYPNLNMNQDEMANQELREMFVKCGEDISKLRGDSAD